MKCYLHIGTEKTGTTTLQSFLNLNRTNLSADGYYFTKSVGITNNRRLPVAAYNPNRRDGFTKLNNIRSNKALLSYQENIIKQLSDEIRLISQNKIIFSSEHIHSRLTSPHEINRLRDILVKLGMTKIIVIVYMRDPADAVNSLHSTAIKCGDTIKAPPSPDLNYNNNLCNHKRTLVNYSNIFGSEAVVPRLYSSNELTNGSIIDDFMGIIDLPLTTNYEVPVSLNKSFSAIGLEVLRRVNMKIPKFRKDGSPNPLRGNITDFIEHNFKGDKYQMSNKLYEAYSEKYKDSNEWVRKKWFPNKKTLFPQKNYSNLRNESIGATDDELQQISNLLVDIWITKTKDYSGG